MAVSVLIVEDDRNIAELLQMYLEKEGYAVTTAFDGGQGLTKFRTIQPDLVLLDVMMPVMDGWTVCKTIRAESATPVIMLTAKSETDDKVAGLKSGADDYITKPFSAPELLARMRAVLRRHTVAEVQEDFYAVGDFRIDFSKRVVTVNGEAVRLTQVEYRIVELIARQPGKVLTYSHIINHIWGPYADNENNRILRVNMSNIRRKIEQDRMAPKYILTEIGVGYRMAEKV